ncbi:MAG: amidohydrolase [Saprospiraceae bacterium]|nr:amidohydrolase [Saprospiraceae bacterium]
MIGSEQVKELARTHSNEVIDHRRHLHRHPELSFEEVRTAAYISAELDRLGIPHTKGRGGNGIVGVIGAGAAGKSIALRADIDALPIQEENEVEYASTRPGVMHACGHDVHTASLLGTARVLKSVEKHLEGSVKLVFQPAEEKLPGGASLMIADGVLEEAPQTKSIFGQHVHPPLEVGKIGVKAGVYMASADEIYLEIIGKGGHAALPQDFIDPIATAAQIISAVQQVISRFSDPEIPSVLSFGKIYSDGGATNIIPTRVYLEGTFRTLNEEWRREAHEHIHRIVTQIAVAMGAKSNLEIRKGYPYLLNNPELTNRFRQAACGYLGEENVVDLPIRMTAEDFAYYSHEIPACFYRLGTGTAQKGITSPVHTPTFDIDESALEIGVGLMSWIAINELSS